ncbi:MAG: aminopeptidase P family N-terminal domain-containing protein, partial [Oricola sp.]|nr:aminopeptidase P family N-terminal domain-containing protein [Oricola sp.]
MNIRTSTEDMLHVFQWKNGDKEWSPFSDAEMDRRQNEMRAHLAANDIDAAVFTSYHGICYYSGFLYCQFGRKFGFVLTADSATTVSAGIDGGQPWRRTHGDNVIYSDWRRDNFFTALKSLIPDGAKRVGIEFDHVSLEYRTLLGNAFPGVEFVDVAATSMWMRTLKSGEEISLIREGTRICNVGARAVMDALHEGAPEYEVAIASTNAMIREIGKSFPFVELMDTWTWFQSGIMTDGAHNPVTNKRVARGDICSLNCFPMIFGYYTAIERTLFCEEASDAHLDLWEKNCAVMTAGSEMIGPGKSCSEIALALNEMY